MSRGQSKLYHYANSEGDLNGVLKAEGLPLIEHLENHQPIQSFLTMQGNDVFRFAVRVLKESIEQVLELAQLSIDDTT